MQDITELMQLVTDRELIANRIVNDKALILKLDKDIKAKCPCPTSVAHKKYEAGGWDYPAQTTTWDECTLCHTVFNYNITRK